MMRANRKQIQYLPTDLLPRIAILRCFGDGMIAVRRRNWDIIVVVVLAARSSGPRFWLRKQASALRTFTKCMHKPTLTMYLGFVCQL